ncbi:hypothetical protein EDEG_01296 [Edhazardia aedis USNM 41457]|uniref:aspartate--tRNA ligase n=1 Tax=Edhazardia aedis (strain USNM 41457) TaxID=1003232 RepID=J9DAE5_EDHAE|nr:hypothetical protein EDEG_01296 [Edhazardia aedis USNM 41457]|eukprot:EJW04479.1 hypothetical protein EDEG_01296 [Edhazardia aedis USNM 41457]
MQIPAQSTQLSTLKTTENVPEKVIKIRGYVYNQRIGKSVSFLTLRQGLETLQCVYTKQSVKGNDISNMLDQMLNLNVSVKEDKNKKNVKNQNQESKKNANKKEKKNKKDEKTQQPPQIPSAYNLYTKIPLESFIEISGTISISEVIIKSATIQNIELQTTSIEIINLSSDLPFALKDGLMNETAAKAQNMATISFNKLLDNRFLHFRMPHMHSLYKIINGFYINFRYFLNNSEFIEFKTPKLIEASSEGGANLFEINFFNRKAYLAQSPQLYKQMLVLGGFSKVFEIGHVYRAEESNINRYLSEFTGVDIEMEILDYEILIHFVWDLLSTVFTNIFRDYERELEFVRRYQDFPNLQFTRKPVVLSFVQCKNLLKIYRGYDNLSDNISENVDRMDFSNVFDINFNHYIFENLNLNDFNREDEKILGFIVKKHFDTDMFVVKDYPKAVRAFYTKSKKYLNKIINEKVANSDNDDNKLLDKNETKIASSNKLFDDKIKTYNDIFSNSFDFILRGEEILSGAQRIDNYAELVESIESNNICIKTLSGYLDAFKYGVPTHGGCGIGFERLLKSFFNFKDIRYFSSFPRDPTRLYP